MSNGLSSNASTSVRRLRGVTSRIGAAASPITDWLAALASAVLLILAFPDFELWPLAAIGLVPLLTVIGQRPQALRSFFLGWLTGTIFFYGSCYWLTYSMIHYGGIPTGLAYLLLLPVPLLVGLFPGASCFLLARAIRRWGTVALFAAAFVWPAFEWARLIVTGQLWNALGYSLAYRPSLIQAASWGGVYAVSFFLVAINSAIAFALSRRTLKAIIISLGVILSVAFITLIREIPYDERVQSQNDLLIVALQPNVPMDLVKSTTEMNALTARHVVMTQESLDSLLRSSNPHLVIWPESPMNFTYGRDALLRELLRELATKNNTSILFNSQEAAPNEGIYNSALFVNEQGQLIAQYDKIRLMPFGEYVPLPRWLPGANLITAIVGDFTPGTNYSLMPVGETRFGVFICIESAYPYITRSLTQQGADVLINISNDGYLGRTAVMRQHLANAVFRAVENQRRVLRVTNTGITAYITRYGVIEDAADSFQPAMKIWRIGAGRISGQTFYSRYGDVFAVSCALLSLILFISTIRLRRS